MSLNASAYAVLLPSLWLQIPVALTNPRFLVASSLRGLRNSFTHLFFMHLLLLSIGCSCWSGSEGSAGAGPGFCGHHTWLRTASLTLSVTTPLYSEVSPSSSSVAKCNVNIHFVTNGNGNGMMDGTEVTLQVQPNFSQSVRPTILISMG